METVRALVGVDLDVAPGTVLGLLGPNGAGKTTIIRILTTLLKPDAGAAQVLGLDVVRDAARLRQQIGLAGQYAAVDENLTGLENLTMVGRLYGRRRAGAKRRGRRAARAIRTPRRRRSSREDLLRGHATTPGPGRGASGRAARCCSWTSPPRALTPAAGWQLWETIELLVAEGTTVLLTTQYLDEADRLATRDRRHRPRARDRQRHAG